MKAKKGKVLFAVLLVCVSFLFSGCEFYTSVDWTFINHTRYPIEVAVADADPSDFYLNYYGDTEVTTVHDTEIHYTYNYSSVVYPYRVSGDNTIIFLYK